MGIYAIPLLLGLINAVLGIESGFRSIVFPENFTFGASSSAYQYEGAAFEGGRGSSIWDNFTHSHPEKIADRSNGDVAVDFYHRYKDDIKLMKSMGLDAFRMSISWPRILPKGKLSGGINREGIDFYNNVFNELIANGLKPFVTLFHWDLPQALEEEYSGFLSPLIAYDFKDYAELCFKEFGDRVKFWMTFNEPYIFISGGYDGGLTGTMAPGRCSDRNKCAKGNAAIEPYIVAHQQLICHAQVVKLYREKYKYQNGKMGIGLPVNWMKPYSQNQSDIQAALRSLEFMYGWFAEPIFKGTYPEIMRTIVGDRLPNFTNEQRSMLIGSVDYLGLNYYTGNFVVNAPNISQVTSFNDKRGDYSSTNYKGEFIGTPTGSPYAFDYPEGLYELLVYTKKQYNNPTIYITENGYPFLANDTRQDETRDPKRITYYKGHIQSVAKALSNCVKIDGFFAWSFMDNFEWASGYLVRYGLYYVDYENGLKRIPKDTALWFQKFLHNKLMEDEDQSNI